MMADMLQRTGYALLGLAMFFDASTFVLGLILTASVRCGWTIEILAENGESKEFQYCPSPGATRA